MERYNIDNIIIYGIIYQVQPYRSAQKGTMLITMLSLYGFGTVFLMLAVLYAAKRQMPVAAPAE